ncbi:hypothetical protein SDRG_05823 [Saprolegnia diclina VS20]|uniref:Helicase-associated domain-containing protein n=1 Tax=Saprolegnia diclina (strain VS20) TaxID=1156394 RepID=T0QQK6_SAPDV|nr:hypothetical protein SDRG_05823 [Saprolegnia diclina VS20]EQC37006.1 hypothetical protein SDRG_05823 [Saprolegnia diclina VS20]|eukprot:XP_008609787.1 hypothetical protein SDRG_05823 [Saprolegnia diclina VS20]
MPKKKRKKWDHKMAPTFVVPRKEPWPAIYHGKDLAMVLRNLRRHACNYDADRFDGLEELGFVWRMPRGNHQIVTYWANATTKWLVNGMPLTSLVAQLKTYHEESHNLDIPAALTVEMQDGHQSTFHVALAYAPRLLRAHFYELSVADVDVLHGLGLFPELPQWAIVKALFSRYKERLHSDAVPVNFEVPATWENVYRGIRLGELAWYLVLVAHDPLQQRPWRFRRPGDGP